MKSETMQQILQGIAFAWSLEPQHLATLAAIATEATFAEEEIIFREGEEGETLYLLEEGQVAAGPSHLVNIGDPHASLTSGDPSVLWSSHSFYEVPERDDACHGEEERRVWRDEGDSLTDVVALSSEELEKLPSEFVPGPQGASHLHLSVGGGDFTPT